MEEYTKDEILITKFDELVSLYKDIITNNENILTYNNITELYPVIYCIQVLQICKEYIDDIKNLLVDVTIDDIKNKINNIVFLNREDNNKYKIDKYIQEVCNIINNKKNGASYTIQNDVYFYDVLNKL